MDTLTECMGRWQADPFEMVRAFGVNPDPDGGDEYCLTTHQVDIIKAYAYGLSQPSDSIYRFLSVKSGQGGGKTFTENFIAAHWVARFHGAKMRVLANSMDQLKDVWMSEFRQTLARSPIEWMTDFFRVRTKDIQIGGDPDWGIRMLSAKDETATAGRHHKHLGIIIDEISGVDRSIIETILGTLTNEDKLCAVFGNPTKRDTYQFDTFNSLADEWWRYTINCEESPIADKAQIRKLQRMYGRDSDVYRVRVLGEFPLRDSNSIMSSDDIEACMVDGGRKFCLMNSSLKQIGIDVARGGNDESTAYFRSGHSIVDHIISINREAMDFAGLVFLKAKARDWRDKDTLYVPDADGLGGGAMGCFTDKRTLEFHGSGSSFDPMFENMVTEAWFNMRELVSNRVCYLPNDPLLTKQLATRNYRILTNGKIMVEPKDMWKKRMQEKRSSDRADGVIYAFYDADGVQEGNAVTLGDAHEMLHEEAPMQQIFNLDTLDPQAGRVVSFGRERTRRSRFI